MKTATAKRTFRLVVQLPTQSRISPAFDAPDAAVQFGRDRWASIKRCLATRVSVVDDRGGCSDLWVAPKLASEVPTGHYAVDGKRYKIARPSSGQYAKWTFVQTGSKYHDAKTIASFRPDDSVARDHQVARAIFADPLACVKAYADIAGTCARCGRLLEDPVSRSVGLGPICRQKFGA